MADLGAPSPRGSVDRFLGLAETYDRYRPSPPSVLVDMLAQIAQTRRPRLVVDLGCGTGLSTRVWADRADEVIGVEPNPEMRRQAESRGTGEGHGASISYRAGDSTRTGLPDGCADIVTCAQSLHWMDPAPTFVEAARVLRRGGVFAAYDADWPPTMRWEAEAAYRTFVDRVHALERQYGLYDEVKRWPKATHLERIRESGQFRFVKEIVLHHVASGDADRLVGLALSLGAVVSLMRRGVSEAEMGLDTLRAAAEASLGDEPVPWYFSYRVRLGVK